jgi:hypothetical protein
MNGALRVQLTKQEKQLIQAAAEKVGESLTEFIHKAALARCTKEAAYQWGHHLRRSTQLHTGHLEMVISEEP